MKSLTYLTEHYNGARERLLAEGHQLLKGAFDKLFEKHPELTCIKWTQHTASSCFSPNGYFMVSDFVVSNNPDVSKVDVWETEDPGLFGINSVDDELNHYVDVWEMEKFAKTTAASGILKDCFGDYAVVTATPTSLTADIYDFS